MEDSVAKIGPPACRSSKRGVGQVLTSKIPVALVGEGVIDRFLEQGTILQSKTGGGVEGDGGTGRNPETHHERDCQSCSQNRMAHHGLVHNPFHFASIIRWAINSPSR